MGLQLEQIETRLKRAERRVIVLGLALGLAVAGGSYLFLGPSATLRATSLELLGSGGETVAVLGSREGRTGLFLLDEQAVPRVSVFHAPDADGLYIDDGQGVTRIGVAQFDHGGGGVALHGPGSRGAAVLYYKSAGSLRFFDADGAVIQELPPSGAE